LRSLLATGIRRGAFYRQKIEVGEEKMRKLQVALLLAGLAVLALASAGLAQSRIEKSLTLEPRGRFVLDSDQGSVTVTGTPRPGARVVITSNRDDLESLFDFSFEGNGREARVTAHRRNRFGWNNHVNLRYEIEVPSETSTDVRTGGGGIKLFGLRGDSELKTSGGSIEVSGMTGKLDAHTSGGSIRAKEVTGDARVDTSGGGIEIGSVEGAVRAHTSGGSIRIERVTGYVEAKTSGGPVYVNFGRGNSHGGEVETSGGSIDVALDPSANLDLDASTSGGAIDSNDLNVRMVGRISRSSWHGSIGSGGPMLRLHTSGGSIHIRAL
jgi:putative adhesin